ncbi:uncharacterized protein LOC130745026 [Lotus japonicus]|uniref:uncharacterized protein LOC130745026 n=1 Tax=Lotus japonicus TaxID=34305 RepID=UPI0025874155|nr:uncharacterized protein LOC130745026 [Lotus japonicus]
MEPHENDNFAKSHQNMPQNKPMSLPSPWSTSGRLNSASPNFQPFSLENQADQGASLPPSEEAQMTFSEFLEFVNKNEDNLQPMCILNAESEIYAKMSPISKPNCAASENMGSSSDVGYEINNVGGATKTLIKDLSSTMKQQSNMMHGNGIDAEKVTSNVDSENTNLASHYLIMDPTELDQNLGQDVSAPDTTPQPEIQVSDKKGKERKRKSNRDLPKKSMNPEQEELIKHRKRVDKLLLKNEELKEKIDHLSQECLNLINENDSLQKELTEKYGAEVVTEMLENFNSSI